MPFRIALASTMSCPPLVISFLRRKVASFASCRDQNCRRSSKGGCAMGVRRDTIRRAILSLPLESLPGRESQVDCLSAAVGEGQNPAAPDRHRMSGRAGASASQAPSADPAGLWLSSPQSPRERVCLPTPTPAAAPCVGGLATELSTATRGLPPPSVSAGSDALSQLFLKLGSSSCLSLDPH